MIEEPIFSIRLVTKVSIRLFMKCRNFMLRVFIHGLLIKTDISQHFAKLIQERLKFVCPSIVSYDFAAPTTNAGQCLASIFYVDIFWTSSSRSTRNLISHE